MKLDTISKMVLILAAIGLAGYAANAFAGRGQGAWGEDCYGPGAGWRQRDTVCPNDGNGLNDAEIEGLYEARRGFLDETRNIRDKLYQKDLELRNELAKDNPDVGKATAVQKEISNLQAELDRKRVEQRLELRKKYPQMAGRGVYGRGDAYGGRGMGRGYGRGFFGGGRGGCWR